MEELGVLMREVERVCKEVGLVINRAKTEYMVEGIPDSDRLHSIDGACFKRSDDFKYI